MSPWDLAAALAAASEAACGLVIGRFLSNACARWRLFKKLALSCPLGEEVSRLAI
tara:strand:+ start:1984 stop:2148 length:165 start_codon:yes stop_codon:yes gene_type:complete